MRIGKYLLVLLLTLLLCLPAVVLPASAALVVEDILLNDTSIYLLTGSTWHFYQGYNFTVKSVNQETESVWLELSLGNKILYSRILGEGDNFIYQKNDGTILDITVNTIYVGDGEEMVAFSPVFQYYDRTLPAPFTPEDKENGGKKEGSQDNTPAGSNSVNGLSFDIILPLITAVAILMRNIKKNIFKKQKD
ncbi:S-layer protein domain-containing protein [Methanomethylovorans sp.]|uniref:S-layer protein domain-containing protein n=1 Tax=Methanomethylovorans sp. TaxID=2758717 RepID=UPI000B27436E|nr:S-layer protein domain-containing protein [Methanomethylovorans sp.]